MTTPTLAELLVQRQLELDKSRLQLSRDCGIPVSRLWYLETVPGAKLSPATLRALARGLELPLEVVLEAAGYGVPK